jgi:hypothetical protein
MGSNNRMNKKRKYCLRNKKTGKIVEKFRLRSTAEAMKSKYQKIHLEEMEVVLL